MMRSTLYLFLFFAMLWSCNSQTSTAVETISPKDFADKISQTPNAQLIDVRTPGEYASDHIGNAQNIDWNGVSFEADAAKLDKSRPVFVYCKVGGRSANAADKLLQMGFTKVYDLQGGILKWNSANPSKTAGVRTGITEVDFRKLTVGSEKVLINFSAQWCAPCRKMQPYLLKMQKEPFENVQVIRLDADANKSIMEEMKIDELPALLLYHNGELTWQHHGFIGEEELKKQLL